MAKTAQLRDLAQGFGLLSDPTRLGILTLLAKGTTDITAACKALRLKQPTLSYHLGILRMGRLVNSIRHGRTVVYVTDKANLKALAYALTRLMPK